ncbi:EAL domain-containing protein [Marinobacter halophilus]|uniref:cyclic-guanylate-specific phosphodiesterase n=1 Tax=Marinobacter halophilus TaxID=1323740 RepID=A0A2T1KJS1_9GAMM|nr:EAL domain-containing protein [Marinobacter halophilus]PSF10258.1 bifunctional diguanylate cyclase/phosphodiesterase [Marinobacter halophilus]
MTETDTQISPQKRAFSKAQPLLLYLLALLVLLVCAGIIERKAYQQAHQVAFDRSQARADLATAFVANSFLSGQFGLRTIAAFVEPLIEEPGFGAKAGLESIERLLDEKIRDAGFIEAFFVTGLDGRLLYSSLSSTATNQAPAWDFIERFLNKSDNDDVVTPLHIDPETGTLSIWRVRKLRSVSGVVNTLLVVKQSPDLLVRSVDGLSLSEGESLALIDENMMLVARLPVSLRTGAPDLTGTRIQEPHTRAFIDSAKAMGQVITASPVDYEDRFYTFRRVEGLPYIVVVGEQTAVALQGWRQSMVIAGVGILLSALIGLVLLQQFYRRMRLEQSLVIENETRKNLQQDAQSNAAKLSALVGSIPDMVFVIGQRGTFDFVHAVDKTHLLRPPEEMVGLNYHDVLPPELASRFDRIKEDVANHRQPRNFDYQLFMDGEARHFEARVASIPEGEEQSSGFLALVQDITDSKLQQAEMRIASTAFETHLGIIITDHQGVILRANRAFTRITGYEEHEVVGQTPRMLQSGIQDKAFYQQLWNRVNQTGSWEGEIWNRRKDGQVFAEWLTVTAVPGESGAILNYVGTFHDITTRKEAERQVHRLAFYDSLTGLANRALLEERIADVGRSNNRNGTHAALLYLDIEQFRAVNDSRGYDVGDLVLKTLAGRLSMIMRENDTLARIGGDEFGVLLPSLDASEEESAQLAELVAQKILIAFASPVEVADHLVQVDVSIGISIIGHVVAHYDQQLQRAEQATQQAKEQTRHAGLNRIAFFNPEMQAKVVEHVLLEDQLRSALKENQFVLYFQPQVQFPDTRVGYEVLLRWQHPERGMVSPAVFIPLAEKSRLILPIGRWVLEQACQTLARWQDDPAKASWQLAVNVSVVQFQGVGFTEQVATIIRQTGAPPRLLKLEVTESLLMEDPERVAQVMSEIRGLGVRFSLDDFGTGYSSLSYLKRLSLDQIKIDQSFVRDVTTNPASAAIVDSIIGLSQGLGLEVIAEGVETGAQRDWLVAHGCDHFQGYLFGRPGPEVF